MNRYKGLVALAMVFCAAPALAQEACEGSENILACYERLISAGIVEVAKSAQKEEKAEVAAAQTGADSGAAGTASSVTDLVPLFDALGLLSDADTENGTLALNLNFLLPVQEADHNAQLKLVVKTSPEPLTQLVEAFPEELRGARKDSLQKDISTFGDSQLQFSWSLMNRKFGRDFRHYSATLEPLFEGAARASASSSAATAALLPILSELTLALPPAERAQARTTPIDSLNISGELKAKLRASIAQAAIEAASNAAAVQAELARSMLNRISTLVDQQPQLLVSFSHDFRDEIVGPEKTSATLTLEITRANLGGFLRGKGAACKNSSVRAGGNAYNNCVSALQSYLGDEASLDTQMRWKLSASYQRVKSWEATFADDGVSLSLPSTDRWEVAAGLGRPLQGKANADRLDFELAYDSNIDKDTSNKERLKASLTYTRRVGDVDMPFSLVYANRNEFLGEVDHQISLHFGLKFKPPQQ